MAVKLDPAILLHPDGTLEVLEVSLVECPDDDPHRLPDSEGERIITFLKRVRQPPPTPDKPTS